MLYSEDKSFTRSDVVHQELNVNLRRMNGDSVTFRCELFDRAGKEGWNCAEQLGGATLKQCGVDTGGLLNSAEHS